MKICFYLKSNKIFTVSYKQVKGKKTHKYLQQFPIATYAHCLLSFAIAASGCSFKSAKDTKICFCKFKNILHATILHSTCLRTLSGMKPKEATCSGLVQPPSLILLMMTMQFRVWCQSLTRRHRFVAKLLLSHGINSEKKHILLCCKVDPLLNTLFFFLKEISPSIVYEF